MKSILYLISSYVREVPIHFWSKVVNFKDIYDYTCTNILYHMAFYSETTTAHTKMPYPLFVRPFEIEIYEIRRSPMFSGMRLSLAVSYF